jgi:hypothetical protein
LTALLWFFAAAGAFGLGTLWIIAHGGSLGGVWPLLLPVLCGALLLGAVAHVLKHTQSALTRYRSQHKPLAGPRPGAALPG